MCHCHSRPTYQLNMTLGRATSRREGPAFDFCRISAAKVACVTPQRPRVDVSSPTRHPSCAYCAESQRPTIHEGEQAQSKREPSPGEQGPSPDDTGLPKTTSPQGDIPTRGCRGTGGPPPTRQLNHCHSIGTFLLYDPGFARRCTPRRIACLPRANGTKLPQALSCTDRELL